MTRLGRAGTALTLTAAVALLGACSDDPPPAAEPLSIALSADGLAEQTVLVGVLVPPLEGPGSEYRPLVEGARVAGYRFGMSGTEVEFAVALDDGTAAGAERAVQDLVDQDVTAVVLAGAGDHLTGALEVAVRAETAVVLPYDSVTSASAGVGAADQVWSTAPSEVAVRDGIGSALAAAGASRPFLVVGDGRTGDGVTAVRTGSTADPVTTAQDIVTAVESRWVDSVVVDASAAEQSALVVELQGLLGSRQVPVVLTPEALTPAFGDVLAARGSAGGWLISVGSDTDDQVALSDTESGAHAALFFAALRLAAGDPTCLNVYGDDSCATSLARADIAAHDATVAVVRAAERAGSVEPSAVRDALSGLELGYEDGLAGPALDFGESNPLPDEAVTVLHASTSDPDLRPVSTGATGSAELFWFAGVAG